jgi:hypothetical protein
MTYLIINYEIAYQGQLIRGYETLEFKKFPSHTSLVNHFTRTFREQNPGATESVSVLIMGLFRLSKKEYELWMVRPIGVLTLEK